MRRIPHGFVPRLGLIAVGALVLRVAYVLIVGREVAGIGDYFFYNGSANLLADGEGFVNPYSLAVGPAKPSAEHPPLWTFVLSVTSFLGGNGFTAHKLTGCLVGSLAIVPIGLLAKRVGGDRAGLIAAGLAAVYPTFVAADGSLMSETLYGFLIAFALLAAYRLRDSGRLSAAAGLGAMLGLAALTRTEALLFIPFLALPVAVGAGGGLRRWAPRFAVVAVAAGLVIVPWTVRNWISLGDPVPVSVNGDAVLAGANCDQVYSGPDTGLWTVQCAFRDEGVSEPEQGRLWRRRGIDYAFDHADRLPMVLTVRALRVWDFWQPVRQTQSEGRHRLLQGAGTGVYFLLLPLVLAGGVILRRRRETLVVMAVPFVVVTLAAMAGWGLPRFRQAAEVAIVVLAAVAIEALVTRYGQRRSAPA